MKLPHPKAPNRAHHLWMTLALFTGAALFVAPLVFGGCTDDSSEPRRGLLGDSCLTTNDCVVPLSCVANVCGGKSDTTSSSSSGAGSGVGGMWTPVDGGTWSKCDECLDKACADELAACDTDCLAIEACIETQCKHLGEIGSSEEGACFANCQSSYKAGKAKHIAVVDCAQGNFCLPPCVPYPQDYDACRAYMDKDICKPALDACNASLDCKNFNDCVALCSTASDCVACDDTPEGQAGRNLREAYERCVAAECISESWLPQSL